MRRTVLLVCRDLSGIDLLSRMARDADSRYIAASDDVLVQEACRRLDFVSEICWLEQMESMYPVAADVLAVLETVNRWLKRCGHDRYGIPRELMPWMQHVEGGFTTQRLQDAVLLIRSYAALFERCGVQHVVLFSGSDAWFDDSVLKAAAQARGISVERAGSKVGEEADGRVMRAVKRIGRAPYRTVLECSTLLRRKLSVAHARRPHTAASSYIVFQLGSAAEKHIENVVTLMKALEDRALQPIAVSCFVPEAADKVRRHGLPAVEVASFLSVFACVAAAARQVTTLVRGAWLKRELLRDPAMSYQGVPLGGVLWRPIKDFLMTDVLTRFCLARALERCFETYPPMAMKTWGEVSLVEGYIAWQVSKLSDRPLLFDYWIGIGCEWPYWRTDTPIDLFLAAGSTQHDELTGMGVPQERIVPVGSLRYADLAEIQRTHPAEASRKLLGIPAGYELYMFWDQNLVLRGFLTMQEQILVAEALLKTTRERRCALIVKPHPSNRPGLIDRWIAARSSPHVFHLPGEMLPYHALNASDLALTKVSTIAVEAMLLAKPVVAVVLDGEPRWHNVFGDAVEQVTDTDCLTRLLARLVDDSQYRAEWVNARLAMQAPFVSRYFSRPPESPAALAAAAIAARINRRHRGARAA